MEWKFENMVLSIFFIVNLIYKYFIKWEDKFLHPNVNFSSK